jgi:hypothetical protein
MLGTKKLMLGIKNLVLRMKKNCAQNFILKLHDVDGIYPRLMKYFYEEKIK